MVSVQLVNMVIALAILFGFLMIFPLSLQYYIRRVCQGRLLAAILTKDKPLNFKLLKTKTKEGEGEFVEDGEDKWKIDTSQVKLVKYPVLFPKALSAFQQIVPCSLYLRGRFEPIDWEDPKAAVSSKEAKAVLDPHWLAALIKGVEEGAKPDKALKQLVMMSTAISVIVLLVAFYVLSKVMQLGEAIKLVR